MTYWHEITRGRGSLVRFSVNLKTKQIVRRSEQEPEIFEAYYVRQSSPGFFPPPEDCVELWPREPITAPSAQEATDKALLLLEIAADGTQDELFEMRPCPIPLHRKRVKEVPSPTHRARAWIYKHSDARYEVRYFGDLLRCDYEEGWRLSVPLVEGMPVPQGFQISTLADSLESAEQIALSELERIVAGGEIKQR